ncbi:MAG: ATP-binding region ATPase domain protein [Gemmatimonadetes bacterium]|nr:ATP-binding region ATPase domain protein [Gemmatimonadota bacterium]
MALSLTITYNALLESRSQELKARVHGLLRVVVQTSETNTRLRSLLYHQVAADSGLQQALLAPSASPAAANPRVTALLNRLVIETDSGAPIELWTADGRRVARVGNEVRGETATSLPKEIRSLTIAPASELAAGKPANDSVQFGSFYSDAGRVLLWAVTPVFRDQRLIGYIAQQRRVVGNAQIVNAVRELSGENFTVYRRNATDGFSSTLDGKPIPPPAHRDTTNNGFVAVGQAGDRWLGAEALVRGTPYIYVAQAPEESIKVEPRATLRRIALLSLLLLIGGVAVTWALSRRITRPLVELTTAAEAIAQGQYDRRVETGKATADEVMRLGTSFNRMASEVEASQNELASQIEEALAVSEELEQTNLQLQHASQAADTARDHALSANRAKSDFLAVMSHELRTPLNAIGGYVEILQLGIHGGVNDAQLNALARIARSQQTLLSLINDVLNFAKLEAGAVRYLMSEVPLAPTLTAIEEFIAPQLQNRRMTYAVHPGDERVTVRADADKLQQILINLLSNAIKYTPEGGMIDVHCETTATEVSVHVHDTGIGVADDRLETIFDPFIQVGRALNRPHDGVGLGLSISRDLAKGMSGWLSVASVLGEGSIFTLVLQRGKDLPEPV